MSITSGFATREWVVDVGPDFNRICYVFESQTTNFGACP
jgi:hypothetical protein